MTRRTHLRRKTRLKARRSTPRRSSRVRAPEFMAWCKANLPCSAPSSFLTPDPCAGPREYDHMGDRPLGAKSSDRDGGVLCSKHHRQRHALTGPFAGWNKEQMRVWKRNVIAETRARYEREHGKEAA